MIPRWTVENRQFVAGQHRQLTDTVEASGGKASVDVGAPLWPDFNRLIGGYFKRSWLYPMQIAVRIEDPDNPINAAFTSLNATTGVRMPRPFSVVDEVYTFNETSWSRARGRVLTSIDYSKMPDEVKAQEPPPRCTDHEYALSYIQREGKGRVFVEVLGHDESIYKMPSMLAHILAGMQYAIGDLQADDSPVVRQSSSDTIARFSDRERTLSKRPARKQRVNAEASTLQGDT
jgi:uncharacterized protein